MTSLERYLAGLPDGLGSFPNYTCKGSLIRNLIEEKTLPRGALPELPADIREYFLHPPLVSRWYPTTHLVAVMHAFHEWTFDRDDDAFVGWFDQVSKTLFRKPLYRLLVRVGSPERLVAGLRKTWGLFHRGLRLTAIEEGKGRTRLELSAPQLLFPTVAIRTISQTFLTLVEEAGGSNAVADEGWDAPDVYRIDLAWD